METLRRSPFKVARIESDPTAFGRRVEDVRACVTALYNRRNVLISGPRGIGKSSLGSQLQIVYGGDATLLERCGIQARLPGYLCAFYACDRDTTLAQLCADVLYAIERTSLLLKSVQADKSKFTFEVDLKLIKTKLETELSTRRPATVATEFVAGLASILRPLRRYGIKSGINIMLDELDQLPPEINFGHFLKIVHETLGREQLEDITFIFAGQRGIYSRLTSEDPSSERIVRHVPIATLDPDEARYVLEYAADHASPPFAMDADAVEMLLAISAGYPYDIHLLGDAAFDVMDSEGELTRRDVLNGLSELFRSDKREKYLSRLHSLSDDQRLVLVALSRYPSPRIPSRIPLDWLHRNLPGRVSESTSVEQVIESLVADSHIVVGSGASHCQFSEELFRIFTSLLVLDQREIEEIRQARQLRKKMERHASGRRQDKRRFVRDTSVENLEDDAVDLTVDVLEIAEYEAFWEREDHSELLEF